MIVHTPIMNKFLDKYGHEALKFHLLNSGFTDDNFFSSEGSVFCTVLAGYNNIDNFISSFLKEKSSIIKSGIKSPTPLKSDHISVRVDASPSDTDMIESNETNKTPVTPQVVELMCELGYGDSIQIDPTSNEVSIIDVTKSLGSKNSESNNVDTNVDMIETFVPKDFTFVMNDLYHLLNQSTDGMIILGKYKNFGILDLKRLKHQLIHTKFDEGSINYKISGDVFKTWTTQFKELFPTVDHTLFFSPYKYVPNNNSISARGAIYNYYKSERSQARLAGLLSYNNTESVSENVKQGNKTHPWVCLTDANRYLYKPDEILTTWKESFANRLELVDPPSNSKEKSASARSYFETFKCLVRPLGIDLLGSDYDEIIQQKIQLGELQGSGQYFKTFFPRIWPNYAQKVIDFVKTSKTKDCKDFAKKLVTVDINEDNANCISLLALPWAFGNSAKVIKVRKSFDPARTEIASKPLTKSQITEFFILHVEDPADLEKKHELREKWALDNDQEPLPYMIFCGPISNISTIYVSLNSCLYPFDNSLDAVQSCYKCLIALNKWPFPCDFVWNAIEKICKIDPQKNIAAATQFVSKLTGEDKVVKLPLKKKARKN